MRTQSVAYGNLLADPPAVFCCPRVLAAVRLRYASHVYHIRFVGGKATQAATEATAVVCTWQAPRTAAREEYIWRLQSAGGRRSASAEGRVRGAGRSASADALQLLSSRLSCYGVRCLPCTQYTPCCCYCLRYCAPNGAGGRGNQEVAASTVVQEISHISKHTRAVEHGREPSERFPSAALGAHGMTSGR